MAPKKKATASTTAKEAEEVEPCVGAETTSPPGSPPTEALRNDTNVAELYATLQAAVTESPEKVNDFVRELLQMLAEAENPDAPLLVRVRTLEFVARYGHHLRDGNALKKIVTSLVKILSGTENTPQLLIAAVQGIAALGPVSVLDKKWEYLSREGADVLMQVMLDENGFAENVRQAASKAFDALVQNAFRPVATKLLHWISDDREAEEEEQLKKERRMAMTRLRRLAQSPAMRSQWTEEVQEHVLGLIIRVLSTVTVREFAQLTSIAAALPMVRESGGRQLLTAFLARNKLNSDRALESLSIIAQHVSATSYDITPALEEASLLTTPVETSTPKGLWHAKILLLAARLATPENTDKLYTAILEQLNHVMGDASVLPENLSTLEALLFAFVAIGQKKPVEFLKQLNEDAFAAKCSALMNAITEMEPLVVYAVKKLMQRSAAGKKEVEALGCCHNLHVILGAFSARHIPMGALTESWLRKYTLPPLKRGRDASTAASAAKRGPVTSSGESAGASSTPIGVLPPPPGTEEHLRKKARTQSQSNNRNKKSNVNNRGGRSRRERRGGFF
ncbi:uncharacterized protein TM35_000191250 [Trypanosoma theileri]|uniref:Uncharacterized protein n=1 Tax=Trypanosoma theileri TaxID=67003 RepID=A0A1X0NTF0_9TRYP|nr:uncharacterized protein TM35_000191250 [Trypanosoma theileri]ORC87881.1 hypothetical protein TM35_000191250 [Trypanosoma theileri]